MRWSLVSGGKRFRFDSCLHSTGRYSPMTVSELIRTKRAVRQFTDEPLSDEAIRSILDAGRRAQSSKNTQPWHFIAIRDRATLRELAECGVYAGHLAGAPSLSPSLLPPPTASIWGRPRRICNWPPGTLGIGSCIV